MAHARKRGQPAPEDVARRQGARRRLRLAAACLLLSGAGSLVLEVVWTRQLKLVFGSSTLAISTILVAYMAGLGLGGWLAGRLAGRLRSGIRAYGWLELAVAACALAVPFVIDALPELLGDVVGQLGFWGAALLRFGVSLAILALPTVLMGATLPVLVEALVRGDARIGQSVGLLYGMNTLGAVGGVFLATFGFFPVFGLFGAAFAGAGIDAVVGLIALFALPDVPADEASARRATASASPAGGASGPSLWLPLLSYGAVGFTALSYEVSWSRALSMVLGSSVYAFASMLGAFLTGIALGSLFARRAVDRLRRPELVYAGGIALLAGLATLTTWTIPRLPDVFLSAIGVLGTSPTVVPFIHVGIAMAAMLPPTLVLGALFPLLVRVLAQASGVPSRAVGDVYFSNTVGSALGAFAAGFVLIPTLGLDGALRFSAVVNLVFSAAILVWAWRHAGAAEGRAPLVLGGTLAAAVLLLVASGGAWNSAALSRGVFTHPSIRNILDIEFLDFEGIPRERILMYRDGISTSVSVHERNGQIFLRVNGKTDAGTGQDMPTQVLSGQIPLLFGGAASDVLIIGWASGVTAGSVLTHPVERVDAVELEPAIVEASRFFDHVNRRPLEDARTNLIFDDGRSFLSYADRKYDVVISEPSNPWISGASNLFTREYFAAVREHLKPGGRFLQWVQLYGMDPIGMQAILAALRSELPYAYAFAPRHGVGDLLLLALTEPLRAEHLPRWEDLDEAQREDLRRIGCFTTEDLWSLLRLLPEDLASIASDAPVINSDRNLFIELRAPRTLYTQTVETNWKIFDRYYLASLQLLDKQIGPLAGERTGALAFSYLWAREDLAVARALVRRAEQRGASTNAVAARAMLDRRLGRAPPTVLLDRIDRALAEHGPSGPAQMLRAELLGELRRLPEVLAALEAALADMPGDPQLELLRARALRLLGRPDRAAGVIDGVAARPYGELHAEVWREQASVRVALDEPAPAAAALERFLEVHPNSPAEWELLAQLRRALGDDAGAERARGHARTAVRNNARAHHRHAREALAQGRTEIARNLLRQALQLDPDYAAARDELAALPPDTGAGA